MKKIILFALFISTVLLFQNCKKSTDDTTTTTTTPTYQAYINGTVWTPDTTSATITYNAAAKTKTLYMVGTLAQKQVAFTLTIPTTTTTADIPLATYIVGTSTNILTMTYSVQQKSSTGAYVFVPQGTVSTSGGSVTVSGIDLAKNIITGTFALTARTTNYDSSGNKIFRCTGRYAGVRDCPLY